MTVKRCTGATEKRPRKGQLPIMLDEVSAMGVAANVNLHQTCTKIKGCTFSLHLD